MTPASGQHTCPYLWPEQQHNLYIHAVCTCTPIKLALTYPLITQIALLGMGPFDCAWTTWTRYPGAVICVCRSILHVLREMINMGEFCPFTCFLLEIAAPVYMEL